MWKHKYRENLKKGFNNLITIDFVINTNTNNINTNKFGCSYIYI